MGVSLERRGATALIWIDNPPVNAASHAVRAGIVEKLGEADADPSVSAVVLIARGATFTAGADIKEFGQPPREPFLPDVCQAIEDSAKPVLAALHGTALGGGLELALAAHGRIIAADGQVGLPEVKLGVIPGAGGTQRLPRLAGVPAAVGIAASGRRVSATEALALGIVDRIAEGALDEDAVRFAQTLAGKPPRRTGRLGVPSFDRDALEEEIAAVEGKARGQLSPSLAARTVLLAADLPFEKGTAEERRRFETLLHSPQAEALRHVFAAERKAGKVPGLENAAPGEIRTVGVVGIGLMGAGIAVSFLDAGFTVRAVEQDERRAEAGRQRIEALYARAMKSGRVTETAKAERVSRLAVFAERTELAPCDLVIEAVFDDLGVKQALFRELSGIVRPDAVLATNTSYLDPDRIAEAASHPERVIGLHFFSPANIMRLVEVVRAAKTVPDVLATGLAVAKRLGKLGVMSGVCEGFIGNRLFTVYRRECDFMLEDGALPQEIDEAIEEYGFPMGPYAVNDLAGLEISWARRKREAASRDPAARYVAIADRLCEMGRFGQKTGQGYYRYESGRREVDPLVSQLVEEASREKGIARRAIAPDEIVERVLSAIVAEGRAILAEGIALRASDIDLVLINGYGYPAWRGGPMFEAGVRDR